MKNKSKYVDVAAICQILGCLFNNPSIFDKNDMYNLTEEDFTEDIHKILYMSFYNLWALGAKNLTVSAIEDYLDGRSKQLAEYKANKGAEYILKCSAAANENSFNYYYQRIKKMSLLRAYENMGLEMSWFLDLDNIFDTKKRQLQEDIFDNSSLEDIAIAIDEKIEDIKYKYLETTSSSNSKLGDGAEELLENLKLIPSYGYPFYSKYMNLITRGMRLGKFYLRSAATGVGKSRSMVADACFIGCEKMYNIYTQKWEDINKAQPVLYIATEQNLEEVTTMAIAFISGVPEEHILRGKYDEGEWERAQIAAKILKEGKVFFECLPDFSMRDIENLIKKHIREHKIVYCCFDYIHSSAKILSEVGGSSGIKGLREDNVLFLLSSKLKDLAVQYDLFVLSSTQLNGDWKTTDIPDQNLLRGAKAIADRIDIGMIMLDTTKEDEEKLRPFLIKNNLNMPNVKLSVYKNRQNKYKGIYLWMSADKDTCRFDGVFLTDYNYKVIEAEDVKIKIDAPSAF